LGELGPQIICLFLDSQLTKSDMAGVNLKIVVVLVFCSLFLDSDLIIAIVVSLLMYRVGRTRKEVYTEEIVTEEEERKKREG
jgi:hypothetical protein